MKALNIVTLLLVIAGGLNWGLIGLFQFDLVAAIFGGEGAVVSRIIYVVIGAAALYQLYPLVRAVQTDEVSAEAAR